MSERVGQGVSPIFDEDGERPLIGFRDSRGRNWILPAWTTEINGEVTGTAGPKGEVVRQPVSLALYSHLVVAGDATAAIQAALNGTAQEIYVEGVWNYSAQLVISRPLRLYGPGRLNETTLLESGILVDGVGDVRIEGLTFTGVETLSAWNAGSAGYRQAFRQFIHFRNAVGGSVRGIRSSGKRASVLVEDCEDVSVRAVRHTGFFGPVASPAVDSNYGCAIRIKGGQRNEAVRCRGTGVGSVVLLTFDTSHNTVHGTSGRNIHDNCVYNSSGDFSSFTGTVTRDLVGSGLKIRGSGHSVVGNTVRNAAESGLNLTGNGDTPDALGANGFGTVATGNTITDCAGHAISVGTQDGLLPRDFVVSGNTIENHTGTGAFAAINVYGERGIKVTGNIIRGSTADYAVIVAGDVGDPMTDGDISGNSISSAAQGIRLVNVDNSRISGNTFAAISGPRAIEARECDNNQCSANVVNGSATIDFLSVYNCVGNQIINNRAGTLGTDRLLNTVAAPHAYEEGTFTPVVTQGFTTPAYTTQTGTFTRIGNTVFFRLYIYMAAAQTRNADLLIAGGLPYAAAAGQQGGAAIQFSTGVVAAGVPLPVLLIAATGMAFYTTSGAAFAGNSLSSARPEMHISGHYRIS